MTGQWTLRGFGLVAYPEWFKSTAHEYRNFSYRLSLIHILDHEVLNPGGVQVAGTARPCAFPVERSADVVGELPALGSLGSVGPAAHTALEQPAQQELAPNTPRLPLRRGAVPHGLLHSAEHLWSSSRLMYLLDTNVVSELRRPRPHGAVLDWIADVPTEQLFVSAVTVGEIQAGIEITREQDEAKAEELEAWLDKVLASYGVLPMDYASGQRSRYGPLKVPGTLKALNSRCCSL